MAARTLVLGALVLVAALAGAAPEAGAGMHVGAMVCTSTNPGVCVGACIPTPLSPPDLCPRVTVP